MTVRPGLIYHCVDSSHSHISSLQHRVSPTVPIFSFSSSYSSFYSTLHEDCLSFAVRLVPLYRLQSLTKSIRVLYFFARPPPSPMLYISFLFPHAIHDYVYVFPLQLFLLFFTMCSRRRAQLIYTTYSSDRKNFAIRTWLKKSFCGRRQDSTVPVTA
ncbi:hypothetical protein H2248_005851 [Termitomyces sp. 'cryptogamus']|nr:hypothetical protein H2248_005851 [Termitomyces sp. 'cryptogamus']